MCTAGPKPRHTHRFWRHMITPNHMQWRLGSDSNKTYLGFAHPCLPAWLPSHICKPVSRIIVELCGIRTHCDDERWNLSTMCTPCYLTIGHHCSAPITMLCLSLLYAGCPYPVCRFASDRSSHSHCDLDSYIVLVNPFLIPR